VPDEQATDKDFHLRAVEHTRHTAGWLTGRSAAEQEVRPTRARPMRTPWKNPSRVVVVDTAAVYNG
jgi:hypothetical protein